MTDGTSGAVKNAWLSAMAESLAATSFVKPGGMTWVSVDLALVMRAAAIHHTQAEAFADDLLQTLRQLAGPEATLLVSAFNFQFPQLKTFDVATAPVQTGAFGALLLRRYPDHRTPQPFYSFLVFGPQEAALLARPFPNSTGEQSIFDWLVGHEVDLVTIGHHYVKSLTSVHHAEEVAAAPYRYRKSFSGDIIRAGQTEPVSLTFFVRELGRCDHSSLTQAGDQHFRRLGLIETLSLGTAAKPLLAHKINLAAAHHEMVESLRTGQGQVVDYYGPQRDNIDVITAQIANQLYLRELKALGADRLGAEAAPSV